MTTIVADQRMGYMASDFMATSNDSEYAMRMGSKIEEVDIGGDKYLVGLAGLEGPGFIFLEWFENGSWDEPCEPMYDIAPEDDFSGIILGPQGLFCVDKFMILTPVLNRWYGVGSGSSAAWAILEAGCGVQKAMETAVRLDPNSGFGFEVKYLDGRHETFED